jgi:hypothetical protein
MKKRWLRWTVIILVGVALCATLGFAALQSLERRMMEAKSVRELSGIVKGKGYRKFERDNAARVENGQYFYINEEGREVQRYPGDEDWLVYYEVDRFDPNHEPTSSRLLENERKRVANGKLRACIVRKERYDQMNVGDRIYASYQAFGDGEVMIWNCSKESSADFRR